MHAEAFETFVFRIVNRDTTATSGTVEQRNLDTAATEFQRRFHISADDEGRHRNSVVNQVSLNDESFLSAYYSLFCLCMCVRERERKFSDKRDPKAYRWHNAGQRKYNRNRK